jgi:endoglucanase
MLDKISLNFLRKISESFGPSGFERETSRVIKEYMKGFTDEIVADKLGSVVYINKGNKEKPHVLLAGHIDEIGFIISNIDEKTGFLSFNPLGGWWDQVLLSQRVLVRTQKGDIQGVIAAKPPHLLKEEERKKIVSKEDMYIDIGSTSKKETLEAGVKIGDPVVPWSPFSIINEGRILMGKAFDDRIGAFVIMEVLRDIKRNKIYHPNAVYGAATVQEEVGTRGAETVTYLVKPDVAIVLEVDISGDIPGIKSSEAPAIMGKGPSLITYDRSMIPNQPLKEFIINTAENAGVPLQLSQISRGGTDAGKIHLGKVGCPSVVIGVPTRHIHSHVGMLSLQDTENAIKLVTEIIKNLDKKIVDEFTSI